MDQPLVSFLTPVHNGEQYIAEAIESVIGQSYSHWDYTIVENCSSDRSLEIAQNYARKDRRINVVRTKELLPIIDNHNFTMRQVSDSSKYCKVLHSDDILFPGCVETMVRLAEAHPSIGIVSSYRLEGNRIKNNGIPYPLQFLTGREVCRRSLMEENFYVFGSPSTLLLRSDLVHRHDPFYSPRFFTDVEACYTLLKESDFGFVHQVLSYSRLHGNSYTSTVEDRGMSYLGNLNALTRFGNFYLNEEEYAKRIKKRLHDYYRYLGVNLIQKRKPDFWQHQEETLGNMGLSLDRIRVYREALGVLIANITNPEQYSKIYRRWFMGEKPERQYRL